MKVVEEFRECDGWAVIVDVDGERMRLHASERPKNTVRWADECVTRVLDARSAMDVTPDVSIGEPSLADAIEVVARVLTASKDERARTALDMLGELKAANDGSVDLTTNR